jgi:Xaa-Pro aminopeptidase
LIKINGYNTEELGRFQHFQKLSYEILESTAQDLQVGTSEKEATRMLRKAFHLAGAHNYFHVPVALFGERSAYPGEFGAFEALPTDRVLKEGDTFILDAAPIFDGYTVDTSCAYNFSNSDVFRKLDQELPTLRRLIKNRIDEDGTFQQIAWEVDNYIRDRGYENCHKKHIGAVLGHRVTKADSNRFASWAYKGLAIKQVSWFLTRSRLARGKRRKLTPNWNHTNACKDVAPHGLWAVEPHLASGNVGVKFEEILLIDEDGARWLDDDLPHHRRWKSFEQDD